MKTIACNECGHPTDKVPGKGVRFTGSWYKCPRCGHKQFSRGPAKEPTPRQARMAAHAAAFERAMLGDDTKGPNP